MIDSPIQHIDEEAFRTVAKEIYKSVQAYYIKVHNSRYHPEFLTYAEWRIILADILTGFWIITQNEEHLPKNKMRVDKSLFLLCRYFYELKE